MDASLIHAALGLYFIACVIGILHLLRGAGNYYRISLTVSTGGFAALSLGLALRWIEAGHPPLTSLYETLLFFAWASWFTALVLLIPGKMRELAIFSPCISLVCLAYASMLDPSIRPLFPALRSNWLAIHVAANFLGYAGFAAAFIAGLGLAVALWRARPAEGWERASVLCVRFGFIFLTYGILTGSVWAQEAWTTYWGWDPKEIWALITWLFYLSFLGMKARRDKGRLEERMPLLTALFAVGGFCFVLFTYFGVSFLLKSLHSYI
jgi:ABC-type transport system involved in cytochrome c biogenesis permease subunit